MKLLMMGPQGSGKGTVGELISKELNIPIIASGQILREVPENDANYDLIQSQMKQGILVSQELVASLLKTRTSQPDCVNGYILDGWGRTMTDLKYFNPGFDHVLFLQIMPDTVVERISNRRTCRNCGRIYNIKTVPPKIENVCDMCGGELYQRADDTPEAIKKRLDIFYNETKDVIEYFKTQGILSEIDAEPMPEFVFKTAMEAINVINPAKNS